MEKELVLLCINSSKFQSEFNLDSRHYEESTSGESRKNALIGTASEKM